MSSLRERAKKDGTPYWQVLYREDGKQRSRAFHSRPAAVRYKRILDVAGDAAALADATSSTTTEVEHTVTTWVEKHIEVNSGITEGTRAEYLRLWRRTFGPLLGELPVEVLTRDMVSRAVISLAARLAYKSVKNARDLMASALEEAVTQGVIPANPTRRVRIPRTRADEAAVAHFLTQEEWGKVLAEIPDHWRPLLLFLVGTGCRINEATAVQIKDLDLEKLTVRIVRAWKRGPSGKELGAPKTRSSQRTIDLADEFRYLLAPLVASRPRSALLFVGRQGAKVSDGNLRERVWVPACERAGLAVRAQDRTWLVKPPRVHDLRHTHVSWAIAAGARMDVVQERLGHKDIRTTMGTYHHLEQGAQRDAARAVGGIAFAALPTELRQIRAAE